uniref:Retrovirus-related Pol polyprotein from transposon TNT 1-94 n=2 Tax=Vitis vinifera TaxID=29760 RepID=A5BGA0_VITVI|nr:hypothetical protein VITISV_037907 [Vitis vinifera]
MCPIKTWFENFKEADGGHVLLGNNKHCKILGTGTVRIKHYDSIERVLEDVRYIPELKKNLISLGMLDESRYTFKLEPNSLRVARGSLIVMKGTIKIGLYTLIGQTVTSKVSTMLKEDMGTTKLWHQRLGHISHRGLQELEKQGVLGNYKLTNLTFCEHCVFGKTTRVKFAKVVHETQNQLDYIHSDLWEPSRVSSIGGARSPSSALQFKTPQEKWIGKAANYQHLKVFGCTTYVHTKTDKLEPRAVKCIFLGYPKGVKGYKLWIETQGKRKCIISRDVTFNEQDMSKQTPTKYVEGSDQLQFEVEHENLQPKKFKETSSKTVQEEIVHERQDEPTQGLESYSLARDSIAEEIVDMEPKTYQEAINSNEANQWVKAIQEEMDSLRKNETWELVTKPSSIRLLLAFVAHKDLELDQLDVKTTFLHGELDELIYMQPPEGFGEGIKDGQRILGMEIERDRSKRVLRLSQKSYISKVLSRFEMNNVKTVSTPLGQHFRLSITQAPKTHEEKMFMERTPYASMVGSVMYTMVCSRPDLAYAVSMIRRYMSCLGKPHWQAVKWLFQYLAGTRSLGLVYGGNSQLGTQLQGFVDADYPGNIDTRKSLIGYVFTVFGGAVSWKANLQSVVALSATEAEYMAMTEVVKEVIWLKGIIEELAMYKGKVVVYCDNQSAIHLAKNQSFHERSKHIDVRLHFVRDIIAVGEIGVGKVPTKDNPSDMLTKSLNVTKFKHCLNLINMGDY